jgi:hypothetical protein
MRSSALEWFPIDIKLKPYGVYFLAYIQDKLPIYSEAIAKPVRFASAECNTCGENRWRKYLQVQPYYINLGSYERPDFNEDFNNDFANAPIRMWNLEDMVFVDHTNYGLNIELDVFCDYEEFFELNRLQFADAFRKQFAVDMLKEFAYNSNARANRFSINASKQELMFELHGSEGYKGLIAQCDDAIKSLDISTRGMNKDCFPCFGGVKYKAI